MSKILTLVAAPALAILATLGAPYFATSSPQVCAVSAAHEVHVLGPFRSQQAADEVAREWERRGYQTRLHEQSLEWYVIAWRQH
jgi:hypothetical protein